MARKCSDEFKKDAVQYLKDHPQMDKREAARNLGVPYDTLYGWYKADRRKANPDAYDEAGRQTEEGFLYLSCIMDLYSRKIVAWELERTLETEYVINAIRKAIEKTGCKPKVIHQDRGVQYT